MRPRSSASALQPPTRSKAPAPSSKNAPRSSRDSSQKPGCCRPTSARRWRMWAFLTDTYRECGTHSPPPCPTCGTKEDVIRSFHRLMVPACDEDLRSLEEFFSALGFAPGESWTGRRSKGKKFEAFESGIELAMGQDMPAADLVVEVENADILAEAARAKGFTFVADIADHDWGARVFILQIPAGFGKLAVFSYNENWRQPT